MNDGEQICETDCKKKWETCGYDVSKFINTEPIRETECGYSFQHCYLKCSYETGAMSEFYKQIAQGLIDGKVNMKVVPDGSSIPKCKNSCEEVRLKFKGKTLCKEKNSNSKCEDEAIKLFIEIPELRGCLSAHYKDKAF